jgi:hypothetical protein
LLALIGSHHGSSLRRQLLVFCSRLFKISVDGRILRLLGLLRLPVSAASEAAAEQDEVLEQEHYAKGDDGVGKVLDLMPLESLISFTNESFRRVIRRSPWLALRSECP